MFEAEVCAAAEDEVEEGAGGGVAGGGAGVEAGEAAAGGGGDAGAAAAGAGGVGVLGAETPAVLEPRPSFWRLAALILPLGSMPLSDWNLVKAAMVLASHLPLGEPW